ncbi:hypothetical protein [Pukyongiella litopenaei]|uniref:Uncharacterized protein n=1 Tax=Pukyongiella litopenaei TaxID=2605946 RepID=A0A2S0MPX2_9RHOB|nr:hypothetical protein [Pukyongiella litopenaei]AVO37942.1 hypothetical protein C6Y53_09655 [Pukyongiella litopenaei]
MATNVGKNRHDGSEFTSILTIHRQRNQPEQIQLRFTGAGSSNRLFAVTRQTIFDPAAAPSFRETQDNVIEKFGLPTAYTAPGGLTYVFNPDLVSIISAEATKNLIEDMKGNTLNAAKDEGVDYFEGMRAVFDCPEKISVRVDVTKPFSAMPVGCQGILKIVLRGDPANDILKSLEMSMADFRYLKEATAFEKTKEKPVPSGDAPKL